MSSSEATTGTAGEPQELHVDCAFVQDLAAPFVLAAVEPYEKAAIDQHILGCHRCARLIAELQSTVTLLAFAVRSASPSAAAKASLFTRIAQASQTGDQQAVTSTQRDSYRSVTLPAAVTLKGEGSLPVAAPAKRSWSSWALPLATVPLVLALALVGMWGISTRSDLADKSAELRSLNAEVAALTGQVNTYSGSLASLDTFFRDSTIDQHTMSPTVAEPASDAAGTVVLSENGKEAMVMVWGLGNDGDQYDIRMERWDGTFDSAGTLQIDAKGNGTVKFTVDGAPGAYKLIYLLPKVTTTTTDAGDAGDQPPALVARLGNGFGQQGDTNPQSP